MVPRVGRPAVMLTVSKQTVMKKDVRICNIKLSQHTLKYDRIVLKNVIMKFHSDSQTNGQCSDNISRWYRAIAKNTATFSPDVCDRIKTAAEISKATNQEVYNSQHGRGRGPNNRGRGYRGYGGYNSGGRGYRDNYDQFLRLIAGERPMSSVPDSHNE